MHAVKVGVIAVIAFALSSIGAAADTITYEGLNFSLTDKGGGELEFTISAATGNSITAGANGDWTGIAYLNSFALKPAGGTYTGASLTGWMLDPGGLAAHGCSGSGAGWL